MKEACRIYRPKLALYAEGELQDRREVTRVRRHLAACADCRIWFDTWTDGTLELLALAGHVPGSLEEPQDGSVARRHERLFSRLESVPPPARSASSRTRWFSVAAAVLIVATLIHALYQAEEGEPPSSGSDAVATPLSSEGAEVYDVASWRSSAPELSGVSAPQWHWVPAQDDAVVRVGSKASRPVETLFVAVDASSRVDSRGEEESVHSPVSQEERDLLRRVSSSWPRVAMTASVGSWSRDRGRGRRWYLVADSPLSPRGPRVSGATPRGVEWIELVPHGIARVSDDDARRARQRLRTTGRAYRLVAVQADAMDFGAWGAFHEDAESTPVASELWETWARRTIAPLQRSHGGSWSNPPLGADRTY